MRVSKFALIFFFSQVIIARTAFAQTPTKLLLKPGSSLKIDNVVKSAIVQEVMGQTMAINFDITSAQKVDIKEKKAKSYLLNMTFTAFKIAGSMMGQDINFDSDKKEDLDGDIGKGLKGILNNPKDVELGEDAKVISIPKTAGKADEPQNDPMAQMLSSFGGGQDESYGTKGAFTVIPAGIKAGDTWSDSSVTEEVKTYTTYKLKLSTKDESVFTISGTQVVSKKTTQNDMEILVTLKGNISGEGTVSNGTGIIKRSTITADSTGSAEVMGQSIPMTSKVTATTVVTVL